MKPVERNRMGKVMRMPISMVSSALRVRSATTLEIPAHAIPKSTAMRIMASTPGIPVLNRAPMR